MHTTYPDSEDTPMQQLPLQHKIYKHQQHNTEFSQFLIMKFVRP